ncbi:MAG: hypothetical protein QM635_00785 [Microbacteriaceae bacterium]
MTAQTAVTEQSTGFTAYEYASVRAPRALESLYRDTYRGFGWTVESTELADPIRPLPLTPAVQPTTITLRLKRDRNIRNRQMVQTLQRKAEGSLSTIARLERSKTTRAIVLAVTIGIVGAAFLAGSILLMNGGLLAVSIVLGVIGVIGWGGGFLAYLGVRSRRTATVIPRIDREFDALYETTDQAARLLK